MAIPQFTEIRLHAPKVKDPFRSVEASEDGAWVAMGLARAYALRGRYREALQWFEQSRKEDYNWCGNCAEGDRVEAYPIQQVWQAANNPLPIAIRKLEAMSAGHFVPLKVHLNPQQWANLEQKQHAAREALLILGQIYLNRGDKQKARMMFSKVLQGAIARPEVYLAATYLDRMG